MLLSSRYRKEQYNQRNLIKDIGEDTFAVSTLNESSAFAGMPGSELQLFRCRIGNPSNAYTAKDMLHLPAKLRAKSGNYRFSIPGKPVSIQHPYEEFAKYRLGFPGMLNR